MSLFNWLRRDPPTPPTDDELPAEVPAPTLSELPTADEPAEPQPVRLDAAALWTAFRENQVAAEARFMGRPLELDGEVDRVDRDHRVRIRVHFKVNPYNTLQALYPEAARAQVARLKPGDKVRFLARVDKPIPGTSWSPPRAWAPDPAGRWPDHRHPWARLGPAGRTRAEAAHPRPRRCPCPGLPAPPPTCSP